MTDTLADRFRVFRETGWRERPREEVRAAVEELLDALEAGEVRAAVPDDASPSGWRAEAWVKEGILAAFALGTDVDLPAPPFGFRDRDTLPPRTPAPPGTRVVPGGSAVRRGAHLGRGVVVMPPAYVNVGAHVGEGSMVDSHALVGSCAQIGRKVHLSAAAQVGGVLEPVGALPVIVEDEVFVGGGVGLYEGVVVKRRSVLAAGVVLTGSSLVYDLPGERVLRAAAGAPLLIPEGSVVVMGARPASGDFARKHGIALATPVIVKRRDEKTDAKTALEDVLRR
ncbi:MAG TPA: 2,3,4,5-tetrahydropyridine-2,6-dicarboxylate N-succinyltransferase [Thermoanaerobaculia bacterium]|nr:2,3,4,5-tetrahydropyridine-2,6-dicarboxylate N-succinyltransferase [Thermoanaerobaculia bacterium]